MSAPFPGDGTNISQRNIGIKQLWVELKYIKMNALKCWNAHKDFAAAGGEPTLEPGQPDWSFVKRVVQVMGCEDNSGLEGGGDVMLFLVHNSILIWLGNATVW